MKKVSRASAKRRTLSSAKKAKKFAKVSRPGSKGFSVPSRPPIGFSSTPAGLLVPDATLSKPIPASKIRAGLKAARRQIDDSLDELSQVVAGPYRISSIELVVSFDVEGKFMGFGVGGATSMKLVIEPDE